jgi:hypothetical protein
LFIGYYSRQNDPNTNSLIMAYGAKVNISQGLASATFECFPISPTPFPPLFAGSTTLSTNLWAFDPVWPPGNVCLDANAVAKLPNADTTCPAWPPNAPVGYATLNDVIHFCADDYTQVAADSTYFYFAWCDRSRNFGSGSQIRPDMDVKFAKIKQ